MELMRFFVICVSVALTHAQPHSGNVTTHTAIPIALGGKHPETAKAFIQLMLPEYDGMSSNRQTSPHVVELTLRSRSRSSQCPGGPL